MSILSIRSLCLLPVMVSTLLTAQVDPRLQACKTDVLDVYTGGKTGATPEIITLIDNSGSMASVAWDGRYFTSANESLHTYRVDSSNHTLFRGGYSYYVGVDSSSFYSGKNITYTVTIRNYSGSSTINYLTEGLLIKPDGKPVTSSDVGSSTDVLKWIARASHVRFAVTSKDASTSPKYTYDSIDYAIPTQNCGVKATTLYTSGANAGTYDQNRVNLTTADQTRVVDLPIPWAVFDRVPNYENRTLSPSPTNMNVAKTDKHPQHTYMFDPVPDRTTLTATSTAQYYEVDTHWWEATGNGGLSGEFLDDWNDFADFVYDGDYLEWCFFGKDVRNNNGTGGLFNGQTDEYKGTNSGGYVVPDARSGAAGFLSFTADGTTWTGNGLPAMNRFQAIKYAIIKTYIAEQLKVWWGIRFLKTGGGGSAGFQENGRSLATGCFNSSNTKGNPGDRMILRLYRPTSANNPDVNMQYIQRMGPSGYTPLTFAMLNTYAQLASTDNGTSGSVFQPNNDSYKGDNPIPSCRRSFLVVLSDGAPNDDAYNSNGGNGDAIGTEDPFSGGTFNSFQFKYITPTQKYFNIYTLAGVAAHLDPLDSDVTAGRPGWPTDGDNAKVRPPFRVTSRPSGVSRKISTMTIGISMPGTLNDPASPKTGLYKTALYGWEQRGSFDSTKLPLPYVAGDDSTRNDTVKNPFFFDAQSPDDIADALAETFALARSVTNTMSAPVAPLVGLGIGKQMYLGTFTTGSDKPTWNGDLLMTGMQVVNGTVTLLNKSGTALEGGISVDTAVWSASLMLKDKGWLNRTLYTLKPVADPDHPGKYLFQKDLLLWNQKTSKTDLPNEVLGVGTDAVRQSLIRFMMGASQEAQNADVPETSIPDSRDLMGDIINSTPAILEFPQSLVPSGGTLATWLSGHSAYTNKRFRLIIVGDNQGILHGFGEVSGVDSAGHIQAAVDELWGIIPPDLLGGLQTWRTGTIHRYLVDGSPVVYFNEQGTPNGLVDGTDIVRVLFGLRKGGRSYYALTFKDNDPSAPRISWMIRPDDSTDPAISNMGFSTSTPAASRVIGGSPTSALIDVFFLGGGLSTGDVDLAFGATKKLGRSVIAVNVLDGTQVKTWDFINDATLKAAFPNMGSIPAGVAPVEVLQGSFKTQRVYFSDFSGGVYALGAKASTGLRSDTSDMGSWSVRPIFHSKFAATGGTAISSTPAIFPLPHGYPVLRTSDPKGIVPTLGVVFGTGDRNDPMDLDSVNPGGGGITYRNRLVMLLDRQDSADIKNSAGNAVDTAGYTEDDLANLTGVTTSSDALITPGSDTYYLKTKSGYQLNYAVGTVKPSTTPTAWYYEKSVTAPLVLDGGLYFSKFAPLTTAGICTGAGGTTYTYRLCDVINPVYNNGAQQTNGCNGYYVSYNDIPSELATVGMRAVVQVGEMQNAGTGTGAVGPTIIPPPPNPLFPRPRAWRIIR